MFVSFLVLNVDLERVKFRQIQEEEAFMVLIPNVRHGDDDCKEAMKVELEKLINFKSCLRDALWIWWKCGRRARGG